ncbi:acyl-CoA ligase (AMP-forming), exosortase A system-associated [Lacimicrobium alkaliphilum]|uniref:Acyl-CoA ligase (AMP-forming), exosortase A system-associated n=1 Tax=Lacimicrobium alkaliphilum TaxID=1526571 RepID=A0ABQ1RPW7_9ALTE|nr:acyl-CoA ligase (AMP-forming), exosortase A system-associated [Lacimicrobium alkaliphilum]GGD75197.1 acyl-CoA ligase (AMP-forming), exosortase A system-associated [Lacimicrobium alkaliphilum]
MVTFFHQLISIHAIRIPEKCALRFKQQDYSYLGLQREVNHFAAGLTALDLKRHDRVGVFLPKTPENVISLFGTSAAGGVFVPINPVLKAPQVEHILNDCDVKVLVTSSDRLKNLADIIEQCPALEHIILTDKLSESWQGRPKLQLLASLPDDIRPSPPVTDKDMAAILYTSGSTGKPKGVVLSHRNLVCGAHSVSAYLENRQDDVILALLPLSFDYGLSQLTTAFFVGATAVIMDFLLPNDVVKAVQRFGVTGLAAVPPLWQQLLKASWPAEVGEQLRYFTNSGGAMPGVTLEKLRHTFSNASPYLMYGLTEAFRSTYLPPELVDTKPGSMGKAIPNAEVMVVRPDGTECDADEPGELVHRGPHVSLGYWNAPEKTAERFKPVPKQVNGLVLTEMAVYSGDTVRKDSEGFLYFVGRKDEMIKTSGYRVSPSEIEEACYQGADEVAEVIATGVSDRELGQAIVVYAALKQPGSLDEKALLTKCKKNLPNFMHPKHLEIRDSLPRNPNGKVDRALLTQQAKETYTHE